MERMSFENLSLAPHILAKLKEKNFEKATAIQETVIPLFLHKKDVIACAKTGSGKTFAFLLPTISNLIENDGKGTDTLILAPTRELAIQIYEDTQFLIEGTELKVACVYGGADYDKQKKRLQNGVNIVVATPGRLLDFLRSKDISLAETKCVILDEADRMLDMGFIDDVKKILGKTNKERYMGLFSATLDYNAFYCVWEFMKEPEEVLINQELIDHKSIRQELLHLSKDEKLPYILQYLSKYEYEPIIVFTNTRNFVNNIVQNLQEYGIPAQGLSSVISQHKRIKILNQFKDSKFRVLVATDVASRGIHIEDVKLVINYDIPQDPESYVHRIGRTARAGKTGFALSICSELDYNNLSKLESYLDYKVPVSELEEDIINGIPGINIIPVRSRDFGKSGRRENKGRGDRRNGRNKDRNHQGNRDRDRNRDRDKRGLDKHRKNDRHRKRDDFNAIESGRYTVSADDIPDYPTMSEKKPGFLKRLFSIFNKKPKSAVDEKPAQKKSEKYSNNNLKQGNYKGHKRTAGPRKNYRKNKKQNKSNRQSNESNKKQRSQRHHRKRKPQGE